MPSLRDLKEELNEAVTLQFISETFTEVNALKIKKIRSAFENNRRFYEEITRIYHFVKLNASKKTLAELPTHKKKKTAKVESPEQNVAYVAITSNSHFYGTLNLNVMRKFWQDTANLKSNSLIVTGQTGVDYLESLPNPPTGGPKYTPVIFKKDSPTREEVLSLLEATRQFDQVLLYYPQFVTVMTQKVGILDITQSAPPKMSSNENIIQFIFEPELPKIVEFFETQVRLLLLTRAMLESDLSRAAARLSSMSAASLRAGAAVKTKKVQISKADKSMRNSRLLDTFAGLQNWSDEEV